MKINGTDLTLYIPTEDTDNDDASTTWEPIALSRSCSVSISADTPDASNKDSSGWAESISGQRSWSISFDGLVDFSLTLAGGQPNIVALWTYFNSRSKIKISYGQDGYYWYGDAYIASLEQTAENESTATFSGSLTGTGALTGSINICLILDIRSTNG